MRKTIRIAILAVLVTPVVTLASGFEAININPRDMGVSTSAVAAQQDAAATFSNPAALSKLSGLNLSLAGSMLSLHTKWTAPEGSGVTGTAETKFQLAPPVALFAAYGTQVAGHGLGIGFGMATPAGVPVKWDEDWQGRGRIIEVERRIYGFYLNAGYEVFPWLRVGGGAIYYQGTQYLKQGIQPIPGAYAELATKGGGFAYQLSTEIKPLENLTLGFDYKHKGTMKMTGDAHFNVPPALAGPSTQDQGAREHLTFPNRIDTGFAWRVVKPVLVTMQYSWSRWSVYQNDTFIGDQGLTIVVPREYRNGNIIRGGVEWTTTDQLTLRAGLMYDWSGYRSSTLSPTLPDANTMGYSAGASWAFNPDLAVHGAFFYADRSRTHATGSAFPGSYKTDIWIASFGVTWRTDLGGAR